MYKYYETNTPISFSAAQTQLKINIHLKLFNTNATKYILKFYNTISIFFHVY